VDSELALDLVATPTLELPRVLEFAAPAMAERRGLAKDGKALPDGSFPIASEEDLLKAIKAYGRAQDKAKAKRFIIRRARELKKVSDLPAEWGLTASGYDVMAALAKLPYSEPACGEFVKAAGPCSLNRSAKHNWVEDVGGLPNYICQIARAVARGGKSLDSAIPIAIATVKKWAAGGSSGNGKSVSPAVRARAAAAVAEWEAKRARAKAKKGAAVEDVALSAEDEAIVERLTEGLRPYAEFSELTEFIMAKNTQDSGKLPPKQTSWGAATKEYEKKKADAGKTSILKNGPSGPPAKKGSDTGGNSKEARSKRAYNRQPAGSASGGQFAPGKARDANAAKAQKASGADKLYSDIVGNGGDAKYIAALSDDDLKKATGILYSSKTSDPAVVKARIAVANEMSKRGFDIKQYGAGGGGSSSTSAPKKSSSTKSVAAVVKALPPVPGGGVDVENASDDQIKTLTDAGWKGKPDDKREALYPPPKTAAASLEESVTITASGAADMTDADYTYYWDPDANVTYRVSEVGIEEFADTQWTSSDLTQDQVEALPVVDDQETLDSLVGGAILLEVEEADSEESDKEELAADEEEAPEGEGEGGGPSFRIPLLIPEGVPSGDRRTFTQGSLEFKEPPIQLLWQRQTDDGHKGSVIVGRIDKIERLENGGLGNAEGVFDTHPDAVEAARQVKERFLTGVSGDVDQFEHELAEDDKGREAITIKHGRLVAATLVAKPAFQEATIEMVPQDGDEAVITAGGGPLFPPMSWFREPKMSEPTMLTVDEDGRVFGLIAEWDTPHTGNPDLRPPKNFSGYRYFNRKPVRTAEGVDVRCGQLTLTGGHADLSLDPDRTVRHYDDTRSAVADVTVGENKFGIWAAGAIRPDVTPEQLRAFRAAEPSGDWRKRDGQMELLACCMVNTAGFPVMPRALCASGEVLSLVAAGTPRRRTASGELASKIEELTQQVAVLTADLEARRRQDLMESIASLRR
jgi:hypothetical protein